MAKPTEKGKISRAVIDQICDYIAKGASYETACKAAGISRRTLYNWLDRAETDGGLYAEFRDRIEQQTAKTNVDLTALIQECALEQKDWRAAQALLQARLPHEFNRAVVQHNHEHQISGSVDHRVQVEARLEAVVAALPAEDLDALVRKLMAAPAQKVIAAPKDGDVVEGEWSED